MADEQVRTLTQLLEDFAGGQEPNLKIRNLIVSLYDALPDGPVVANGQSVSVRTSTGADAHTGTAVVSGQTLTGVNLPATTVMVDQADVVSVRNSAGADPHNATAQVAAGAMAGVNLAATVAMVDNNDTFLVVDANGSQATGTVALVSAGVLQGASIPGAQGIIAKSGVKIPCPAPTGTYVDGITLTINASAQVTAVLLS